MLFRREGRRATEEFGVTPLVDVMFNLLIFIIVTAQYTNIQALKVNLPKAEAGQAIEKSDRVVVTVGREGDLLLNGEVTTETALGLRLRPFGEQEPQPAILIQADEGSTTGLLVRVMDLASKASLRKISIETRK